MLKFLLPTILIVAIPPAFAETDFISGKVLNAEGIPEAGVWVIAETEDLPTEYRKLVVTDAAGRFLLPEMPSVEYEIWVRGYGLADSDKIKARVGDEISLTVHPAHNARKAANIYPANYWLSLLEAPPVDKLKKAKHPYSSQMAWLSQFNLSCNLCHQTGSAATRFPLRSLYDYGLKEGGNNE